MKDYSVLAECFEQREYFCECYRAGKTIMVECYQSGRNMYGEKYYSRCDGITSKQRKRVLDWAVKQPMEIRKAVYRFLDYKEGMKSNA